MSDPTTVNKTASVINRILKEIIEGAGVSSIEAIIIAEQPWLGWPFFKQILHLILNKLAGYFYTAAANAATKIVIDTQISLEKSAVYSSFQDLQMAIASEDPNAIKRASNNLDEAYKSLIHYDGSASP